MLDLGLSLLDHVLNHLVRDHHEGDGETDCAKHALASAEIRLKSEAEGKGLFVEVQSQLRILRQVSHH